MSKSHYWSNRYEQLSFDSNPKDAAKTLVREMEERGFSAHHYCDEDMFDLKEKDVELIGIAARAHKEGENKGPVLKMVKDWLVSDSQPVGRPEPTRKIELNSFPYDVAVLEFYELDDTAFQILKLCNLPIRIVLSHEESGNLFVAIKREGDYYEALKTICSVLNASGVSNFTSLEPYHNFDKSRKLGVIAENIGAASSSEWLKWYDEQELVYAEDGDLTFDDLDTFDLTSGEDILLGKGLLCSGEAIGLYGDSGIGKSVLVKQWAICAAAGMPFFRIPTSKPCKVLIFQGENGNRAEAEAIQGIRAAMTADGILTAERLELVRKNFVVIPAVGFKGNKFMGLLRRKIRQHKPDLVFIDPLLGVADGNLSSQEYMSDLLRENIIPMAREFNVGIVVVHHSGKSGAGTKDRSLDEVKNGALGSMDFAASLRAIIGLFPKTADGATYELVTTKRGGAYLGRKDDGGNSIDSDRFNIRHSMDGVAWIAMDMIAEAANTQDLELDAAIPKVAEFIRAQGTVRVTELQKFAKDERFPILAIAIDAAVRLAETKPEEFYCYQLVATGSPRVWSTSPEPEENRRKREDKSKAKKV
jgi:hypothetical protein